MANNATLSIDEERMNKFRATCKKYGLKMSSEIRALIDIWEQVYKEYETMEEEKKKALKSKIQEQMFQKKLN